MKINAINVNDFGKENKSYITDDDLKNLLSIHFRGIQKLIRMIYFNDDHPENYNIRPSTTHNTLEVLENNKFIELNKEYVLDTIIIDAWGRIVQYYEKLEEEDELDDFKDTLVSKETEDRLTQFITTYKKLCQGEPNITCKEIHEDVMEMIKFQYHRLNDDKNKKKTHEKKEKI